MFKFFVFALFFICTYTLSTAITYMVGPKTVFPNCPNITYLEGVDKKKLIGTWYLYGAIVREENELSDLITDCSVLTRSGIKKKSKNVRIGKKFIVATDYISYLLQMNCQSEGNNEHTFMIRIFTRKNKPTDDIFKFVIEALSKFDVSIIEFHKTFGKHYCVTFK